MKLIIFFFSPRHDGITKYSRVKKSFWKTRTHFRRVRVSTITTNHTFMAITEGLRKSKAKRKKHKDTSLKLKR